MLAIFFINFFKKTQAFQSMDFIKLIMTVRYLFYFLALSSAVNRWGCQVEFLSHTGSLRKNWKVSTTEKTIFFFCLFIYNGRDSLAFSDQVSVGILTFVFLSQDERITLLFWGRHFGLETDLEINTFHFRFSPKDLKVFWSVNTQIPFESYRMKLEYPCLLKEMRHSLITVITMLIIFCAESIFHMAS